MLSPACPDQATCLKALGLDPLFTFGIQRRMDNIRLCAQWLSGP